MQWLEEITYLIVIARRAGERRRAGAGAGRTFVIRLVRGCSSLSLQPALAARSTHKLTLILTDLLDIGLRSETQLDIILIGTIGHRAKVRRGPAGGGARDRASNEG